MPWLGSEDPCSLLAFCPPFSHQTNTGSGTKGTFTQSSESSSIFHILCLPLPARGATTGPHMLDALLLPGCLILALTKHSMKVKLTAFHTVRFWHCPGTSEHTLKRLSAQTRSRVSPQHISWSHFLHFSLTRPRCFLSTRLGSCRICKFLPGWSIPEQALTRIYWSSETIPDGKRHSQWIWEAQNRTYTFFLDLQ